MAIRRLKKVVVRNILLKSILINNLATIAIFCLYLAGCGITDRLNNVGRAPALSKIENPATQPGYSPVRMPMPPPERHHSAANSLWQTGSRAFFKDQRAARVGDILTVVIRIADRANFENQTARSRKAGEDLGSQGIIGDITDKVFLPSGVSAASAINLSGAGNASGKGTIKRSEEIVSKIAAVITQVMANGNMVIEGRQEVRVNFEVRDLIIRGVVRPEDITAGNTIDSDKIAYARISYGGRGQITDVQQPRYGNQVLDIVLPF